MSFNVATLQALQAEGLDLAACIRVLSTVEPKADTAAEKRRAYDRERKAEQRAEAKSGGMSGGNPPDPAPNERDILTPTRERKIEAKASSKSGIGTRLPDGWEPKPLGGKTAEMVAAWPAGMIERELAKFKDHWLKTPGSRGRSLDWDASYRNWLRNADERKPRHGQPSSNIASLRGTRPDPALDLLRAARAAEDREDHWRAGAALPAIRPG